MQILVIFLLAGGLFAAAPAVKAPKTGDSPVSAFGRVPELSCQEAREDLSQLRTLLEDSHPDPFLRSGGLLTFRRRFALADASLPKEGLSRRSFLRVLQPLMAQVGDGHTELWPSRDAGGLRVWIGLLPVDGRLVISAVYAKEQQKALGAVLEAVEGVPVAALLERMGQLRGYENLYTNLNHLAETLASTEGLEGFLRRPGPQGPVLLQVRLPDGTAWSFAAPVGGSEPPECFVPARRIQLPTPDVSGMAVGFLGPSKQIGYFRMDSAMRYREAFELRLDRGTDLKDTLEPLVGPEGTLEEKLARVPAVTERLQLLMTEMKARRTPLFIVDLRQNQGGNSFFADILEYFLYPLEQIAGPRAHGYQIPRFSRLYFQNYPKDSLIQVRTKRSTDFQLGDLDFSQQRSWEKSTARPATADEKDRWIRGEGKGSPTFARALRDGCWNAVWTPRVMVLTSAATYSAGFDALLQLRRHGASVVGVPSAQAANCFIDTLSFKLAHSGIQGGISFKWSAALPDEPASGNLLHPDLELTYEKFKDLQFDSEASLLLAMEAEMPKASTKSD